MKLFDYKNEKGFTRTLNFTKFGLFDFSKNKMNIFTHKNTESKNLVGGFTLIEVMISIGLFTVIMIIGITAILGVNNTYRKNRSMRSAVDNMSFIMEDMARNIRLGYLYRCLDNIGDDISPTAIEEPQDGPINGDLNCRGIAFEPFSSPIPGDPTDQVVYFIEEESESIFKSNAGSDIDSFLPMNSIDLKIDIARSGFIISGTSNTDNEQPTVLIRIAGKASSGRNSTDFNLQTTVTQRLLDAPPNP